MPTSIFESFDKDRYLEWHRTNVDMDIDFEEKLNGYRDNLKTSSTTKLETLGQLLSQIKSLTEPECKLQSKGFMSGEFELPTKYFTEKSSKQGFDLLFKSTGSIIEKCWRKNATRNDGFVGINNINNEITDLIRTSVISPTLLHAKMFSERLEAWKDFIPSDAIKEHFSEIKEVKVDKEAKPASGYFAYHCLVYFNDGLAIEVQVYSLLSSAWRNISHKLYEKTRAGSPGYLAPGSPESRLISLGHMLHLAECELDRLINDLQENL